MKYKTLQLNDNFLAVPICHRGLHSSSISENSMEAFKLAKEKGFAIELDIHKLSDGNFAVFHDKNMKRMTDFDIDIESLTIDKLKQIKLQDGQRVPLFEQVLEE